MDENKLIKASIPEGMVTYREGNFDHYGERIVEP